MKDKFNPHWAMPMALLFAGLLLHLPLLGQTGPLPGFPYPGCVTFKYACTAQPTNFPETANARFYCQSGGSAQYASYDYPIVEGSYVCHPSHSCSELNFCLLYGLWRICNIQGTTAYVYQMLSNFPRINGELIGLGHGAPYTSGSTCIGRRYSTLNNIHSRTQVTRCDGDTMLLSFDGLQMYGHPDAGICLTVTVKSSDQQTTLASETYGTADFTAQQKVDITDLLSQVANGVYYLEFKIHCCESSQTNCGSINTELSAFIEIEGEVSYQANFQQGGGFSGCPLLWAYAPQTPPGPIFATGCNVLFNMYNIYNPNNLPFTFTLSRLNCETGGYEETIGTISETPQGATHIFTLPAQSQEECRCYRLDVSYFDSLCNAQPVMESYYYRVGSCTGLWDPQKEGSVRGMGISPDTPKWRLYPNPAGEVLYLESIPGTTLMPLRMEILDAAGRTVMDMPASGMDHGGKLEVPLHLPPGMYFYRLHHDTGFESGRFVKQ